MQSDPVKPVLPDKHLIALDRRLRIILQAVRDCVQSRPDKSVVFFDDEFQNSRGHLQDKHLESVLQLAVAQQHASKRIL
jgi:hypothetical protein